MKGCSNHREILWLDVLGELNLQDGWRLQRHLESCPECRKEKEKLSAFLRRTAASLPEAKLSAADCRTMNRDILRKLREESSAAYRRKARRLVPALAAALLVMTGIWLSVQGPDTGRPVNGSAARDAEEEMILKDIEIIRNLDFLKEMDSLRKLVRLMDGFDSGEPPANRPTGGVQGSESGEANA